MALVLLIIGLPIVLATAFVQEGMSGRERSDADVAAYNLGTSLSDVTHRTYAFEAIRRYFQEHLKPEG